MLVEVGGGGGSDYARNQYPRLSLLGELFFSNREAKKKSLTICKDEDAATIL